MSQLSGPTRQRFALLCALGLLAAVGVLLSPHDFRGSYRHFPTGQIWKCRTGIVRELEFAPDDSACAVLVWQRGDRLQRRIIVLRAPGAQEIHAFDSTYPSYLCFSPNAELLALIDFNGLAVHDLSRGAELFRINLGALSEDFIGFPNKACIGFTNNNEVIVAAVLSVRTGTFGDRIALDLRTGKEIRVPQAPIHWTTYNVSPDGSKFYHGGSRVFCLHIRATKSGDYAGFVPLDELSVFRFASFTPDGRHLVTIHEEEGAILWELQERQKNAVWLKSEFDDGFRKATAFGLLPKSGRLAYADQSGGVHVRSWRQR